MMFYPDDFTTKSIKEQQVKEYIQQAEIDRLEASLNSHRTNPLIHAICTVERAVGYLFAANRRMERVHAPRRSMQVSNNPPCE